MRGAKGGSRCFPGCRQAGESYAGHTGEMEKVHGTRCPGLRGTVGFGLDNRWECVRLTSLLSQQAPSLPCCRWT